MNSQQQNPPKKSWAWPLSSTPVAPENTEVKNKEHLPGSLSFPGFGNNKRGQETQTENQQNAHYEKAKRNTKEMPQPRHLASMKKFPVDDDEVLVEEPSGNVSSFMSEIVSEEVSSKGSRKKKKLEKVKKKESDESNEIQTDLFTLQNNRDPFNAPYGFIIMCSFQIVWGICCCCQVLILRYMKTLAKTYILLDKNFSDHSPFYLLAGAITAITSGICGLIALAFDFQFLFYLIPHFMWMIVTMCLCSSITARGNLEQPTFSTYYRLFEAAALYKSDPSYLKDLWPHLGANIWDEMQKTMRCCGVEHALDWLNLPNKTIPDSCCVTDNGNNCQKMLGKWTLKNHTINKAKESISEISGYLFEESCIEVITVERRNHIRDWTIYPLIYLAFHLLMLFNINYLTHLLINEYHTWQGLARLKVFKSQGIDLLKQRLFVTFLKMIPFFFKTKKEKAQRELDKKVEDVENRNAEHSQGVGESEDIGTRPRSNSYIEKRKTMMEVAEESSLKHLHLPPKEEFGTISKEPSKMALDKPLSQSSIHHTTGTRSGSQNFEDEPTKSMKQWIWDSEDKK